jgi:ABC-type transport system involved in multi-copper enzyme maturation permease subunit
LLTIIGVTWRRFLRGRAVWVAILIAILPVIMAAVVPDMDPVTVVQTFVMLLLPPMFVAAAIGEEIEDRTSTYLWSRPIARWTLLVGKLLALAPIAVALITLGWLAALQVAGDEPSARTTLAFAAGGLAASAMSAGIGMVVPKHGMALSIVYLVILDLPIGAIPASVQSISLTRQVRLLSGLDDPSSITEPAITMAIIAAVWLAIGLWRLRRLEA